MTSYYQKFSISTKNRASFTNITERITTLLSESAIQNGIIVIYSQHTTCSIIIQEDSIDETYNGIKFMFQDLLDALDKLIPICRKEGQYMHPGPLCVDHSVNVVKEEISYTLNTDAHLRSSLFGRSETLPIVGGKIELGENGQIYFADFDQTRARTRTVHVHIVGDK
jgi:thiamine phosphate synthase YjbQ (UPF0047 family)